MKRAVALLGKDEVDDIVRSQGKIEVGRRLHETGVTGVMPACLSSSLCAETFQGQTAANAGCRALQRCGADTLYTRASQVECEFCKEQYQFTEEEILEVLGR